MRAHLPPKLVDALEDLIAGSEPKPRKEAKVFVNGPSSGCILEDNLMRESKADGRRIHDVDATGLHRLLGDGTRRRDTLSYDY